MELGLSALSIWELGHDHFGDRRRLDPHALVPLVGNFWCPDAPGYCRYDESRHVLMGHAGAVSGVVVTVAFTGFTAVARKEETCPWTLINVVILPRLEGPWA